MLVDSKGHAAVVRVEDRLRDGGIGMVIADRVRAFDPEITVRVLGFRTRFIPRTGTRGEILSRLGVEPARVAETVKELCDGFLD